jgi:VWFA-related protein
MNHRVRLVQVLTILLLLGSQPLRSQGPNISVDVKVVNVLATVRDKHGEVVRNLTKDDFTLDENGRPQAIQYFSQESNLPLALGLLVDTSMSQRRVLDKERTASYSFLDKMLQPKDVAFLIHFDREVVLLQDLTSSHEKLESALRSLQTPSFARDQGDQSPDSSSGTHRRGVSGGGGTLLYDAIFLASDELMKKQQGRKALVVLSDGVDRGSKETLQNAIESAQRADTVVYSILFADEPRGEWGGFGGRGGGDAMGRHGGGHRYPQESRPDGEKILERISKETGGRLFEVSKKQSIEQIYGQVQDQLRSQYNLGYTPDKTDIGPGYRRIHLTTKQKNLAVQARDGYYAER